jgi:hypothetical protein
LTNSISPTWTNFICTIESSYNDAEGVENKNNDGNRFCVTKPFLPSTQELFCGHQTQDQLETQALQVSSYLLKYNVIQFVDLKT